MRGAHWQEPNLARAPFVNERPVRRLAVALWVLFVLVGGAALWMSQTIRRETGTRVAELARLNAETIASRERAVALEAQLMRAGLTAQNERAEFLNRRLAERTFSWNNLLETLSGVLPRGVRLIALAPQGFSRERSRTVGDIATPATTRVAMRITGEAEETEALLEFVDRLFAHPAFDRPNLARESAKKDDKIQFDLSVDYLPQVVAQPGLLAAADESAPGRSSAAGIGAVGAMGATAAIAAGTAGADEGASAVGGGRIQSGQAAPGGLASSARAEAAGAPTPSGSARRPPERVGRAAPGAAATPEFGGSSDEDAAAGSAPGGRVRPGSPGAPGVPPGTGPRFPATVLPTPLRPYASGVGGG